MRGAGLERKQSCSYIGKENKTQGMKGTRRNIKQHKETNQEKMQVIRKQQVRVSKISD
jgi:hypothetical protein